VRRSRILALGVILFVALSSAVFAWRWRERGPAKPSVSAAIGRFRTSSTIAPTGPRQPPPGVYVYAGGGSESLSFLATKQSQGPNEPGTIVAQPNGCWQFRLDYNSFHSQTWNRCATATQLVERGGTTTQRFDFVTFTQSEHSVVTCTPPMVLVDLSVKPGTTTPIHCTGRSQTTKSTFLQSGTVKFVARETVVVGGAAVPAVHARQDTQLSGGQTGEAHTDIWLAVSNGLPLKESHTIRVVSPAPAPLNQVTYKETGHWQLTSLTPRT
jgi:hypothetical protein